MTRIEREEQCPDDTASENSSVQMTRLEREEQRPDALGRLDETEDARDAEYSNDSKQRWIWRIYGVPLSHLVCCKPWKQKIKTYI